MDQNELSQLLKQNKILSADKIEKLEKEKSQYKTPIPWEDFLVEKKILTEPQLLEFKSKALGVPVIDLKDQEIAQEVLNLVPEPIAHRHHVISFKKDKESVSLAMVDPEDLQTREFIKKKTGLSINTFLIGKSSLDFGLGKYHSSLEKEIKHLFVPGGKAITDGSKPEGEGFDDSLKKMAEEIPVIRVVDTLLEYAIFEKASDIHIEPQENAVTVRYRIDGVLHDVMTLPKVIQAAIVARIKVLSNLKIDEHRLPQDGRFKVEKDGYKFSLRVSTIPIFDGEKVVIRLLEESARAATLDGIADSYEVLSEQLQAFKQSPDVERYSIGQAQSADGRISFGVTLILKKDLFSF